MSKYLDFQKNVIPNPVSVKYFGNFKQENFYSDFKNFFIKLPWFKEKVNDIYIHPVNENAKEFVISTVRVQNNHGLFYYKTNKIYYEAQVQAEQRYQQQNIHRIVYKSKEYDMIIGIVTPFGIIDQTEEIFTAQCQFIDNWKSLKSCEMDDVCNSPVNLETFSLYVIAFFNSIDFKEEQYIKELLQCYYSLFKTCGKLFMTNILDLLIYINPRISIVHKPTFSTKFKKKYYKPQILPFLNEYEKLPEIFNEDAFAVPEETKENISKNLYNQKEEMFNEWIGSLLLEKTLKKSKIKPIIPTKFVNLPQWKNACKNYIHIQDIEDEDLVFIREENEIYGFSIVNMFDIIENQYCQNPYTKNIISKEFVARFLDTYYKPKVVPEFKENKVVESTSVNVLQMLLEKQLNLYEKKCVMCCSKPWREEIYIETHKAVYYFCSSECMARYTLENSD